ncbi:MAG: oligosaccharide flippase family protein [Bacteroidales bacterium]
MNKIKALAGQVVVYGLGTMLPRLLNFAILTPYFTRVFSKGEYGIITEFYAYIIVLQIVLTYGMETGYFRFSTDSNKRAAVYANILTIVGLTSLLFIVGIALFRNRIAAVLDYSGQAYLVMLVAIIVAIDAFTAIPFAKLRQEGKALKFAVLKIVNILVTLFLVFLFLSWAPEWTGKGKFCWALGWYNNQLGVGYVFLANAITSALMVVMLIKELRIPRPVINFSVLKPVFLYSFPVLIAGLGGSVNEALDRILLRHLLPASSSPLEQVGIYGANYKIAVLMTLFVQMFRYASEPFFFGNMKDKDAKSLYGKVMNYFVIVCLFIFVGIILFMDLVKYFIGVEFRVGLGIVPIVLFANMLVGVYFNLSVWYKLNKMTYIGALLMIMGAMITIGGNILLIPRWGYLGSAWTHVATYTVMIVACYILGMRYYPVKYDVKRFLLYTISAVAVFFAGKLTGQLIFHWKMLANFMLLICFSGLVFAMEKELRSAVVSRIKNLVK